MEELPLNPSHVFGMPELVKLMIRRANFSGLRRSTEGSLVRYASQHYFRRSLV
jgi:hypothetical protein